MQEADATEQAGPAVAAKKSRSSETAGEAGEAGEARGAMAAGEDAQPDDGESARDRDLADRDAFSARMRLSACVCVCVCVRVCTCMCLARHVADGHHARAEIRTRQTRGS